MAATGPDLCKAVISGFILGRNWWIYTMPKFTDKCKAAIGAYLHMAAIGADLHMATIGGFI